MRTSALLVGCGLAIGGCGDNTKPPAAQDTPDAAVVPATPDAPPAGPPGTAIPLSTPDGSFYTAPLAIGTQTFALDVDTGSTTTGVAAMACTQCTNITPLYTPGATAMDQHQTAQTGYADGSRWQGEIFADQMGVQHDTPSVAVSFVGITKQRTFFDPSNAYQGILGLGPSELLEPGTTSYLDQLTAASVPAVLGFEMCDAGGTMWVGGFDASHAASAMAYTPMLPIDGNSNPFYAVDLRDVGLGGTSLGFGSSTFGMPIVDTGTTYTYIPETVIDALLAKVNAVPTFATLFTAPLVPQPPQNADASCQATVSGVTAAQIDAALPPMSVTFPGATAGETFTVSVPASQSYLYDAHDGTFCLAIYDDGGSGSLLGDATMRGLVTVFDVAQHRMGFARDAGCATARRRETPRHWIEHGHPHRHR